jgi:hypothetical protein
MGYRDIEAVRRIRAIRKAQGRCTDCGVARPLKIGSQVCVKCGDRCVESGKRRHSELKASAFQAYGGAVCVCCRESTMTFLSIDHVGGGGGRERMNGPARSHFYRWLKGRGYPPGYRVLCFNCNHGRYLNGGVCPHEEQRGGETQVVN